MIRGVSSLWLHACDILTVLRMPRIALLSTPTLYEPLVREVEAIAPGLMDSQQAEARLILG